MPADLTIRPPGGIAANVLTGVAFASSTNGGKTFGEPVVAISKDGFTHEIVKDSLAVNQANPSQAYIAYVDLDYSGMFAGLFPAATRTRGSQIPRYAIEWWPPPMADRHGAHPS